MRQVGRESKAHCRRLAPGQPLALNVESIFIPKGPAVTKLALSSFALCLVACSSGSAWTPFPSSSSGSSGDTTQDPSGSSSSTDPAAGSSSTSTSGAVTSSGGSGDSSICDTKSKCAKDPSSSSACKSVISGNCGSSYAAYYACYFAKQTCTAQEVTDTLAISKACSAELNAAASCVSKSSSSSSSGND